MEPSPDSAKVKMLRLLKIPVKNLEISTEIVASYSERFYCIYISWDYQKKRLRDILLEELGIRKLCASWVLHFLNADQKQMCAHDIGSNI
ncbi:hypothetical protein LAZ67_7001040 [Cordylochernes scorpioides]|uniref:Uncharacterized protein n=1 Tax=Cordylochernes scorpioides TaxID=51811 RepID=A0ABY6KQ41_9ARAC|nr:hypothetical protein LAZ67_7001040 [Cordylochernes scorpioides]